MRAVIVVAALVAAALWPTTSAGSSSATSASTGVKASLLGAIRRGKGILCQDVSEWLVVRPDGSVVR